MTAPTSRPVVVGIDGSDSALAAARWGAVEARRRNAPLRLVTAFAWTRNRDLVVVTNSLLVAEALIDAPAVEVHVTGGTLRTSIHALVGPEAEQGLSGYRTVRAFISGNGVTAERGLTTPNPLVASADRALAAAAREVVVLADSTKIGQDTMCQTIPADAMTHLIVDVGADPGELDRLRGVGVRVQVVTPAPAPVADVVDWLRPVDA